MQILFYISLSLSRLLLFFGALDSQFNTATRGKPVFPVVCKSFSVSGNASMPQPPISARSAKMIRDPKSAQHVISQSAIINVKYMSNDLKSELRFWFTIVSLYKWLWVCVCFLGAHNTWRFYPRRGPEIQDTNAKVKVAENLHSPQSKHCLGLELELELELGPRPALTLIHTHTVAHSARQLWGYLCILSCNCDSVSASTTPALALYLYLYLHLHLCPFQVILLPSTLLCFLCSFVSHASKSKLNPIQKKKLKKTIYNNDLFVVASPTLSPSPSWSMATWVQHHVSFL